MLSISYKSLCIFFFLITAFCRTAFTQEALKPNIQKPDKFENRKLGYEKTDEKKFGLPRRLIQNASTHYNYYFNANNKLNEVIARAKAANKDNYSQLLPFYNYSLEQTAKDKTELDSVIYKATVAILIHDLRNSWLDNMYLLMGKAYYFRKSLDSAYQTFQYINYAFAPKEKDGYDKVIGSNAEGGNSFSIVSKESGTIIKKAFTQPPSRNDAFIWQIRTYIQNNEFPEAAGLIETLKNDPFLPARLKPELNEVQAFWFYRQNSFDSAAKYLVLSLNNAENGQELARWEYLAAQLYQRSNKSSLAQVYFAKSIKHTLDPVMEVYARLNLLKENGEETAVQQNINELLRMARKEKYYNYRDLIYYTAAQMELDLKNIPAAYDLLLKSTRYSFSNQLQRNKSFIALGDISYEQKDFISAKGFYDSVNATETLINDLASFNQRKQLLTDLAIPAAVIYRQDSLQRIAALPEHDREVFIRKLLRQIRKSEGLKEDEPLTSGSQINNPNDSPTDLFNYTDKSPWYFSNASLKAKGYAEFKLKWGNRPNVDNWRRISSVIQFVQSKENENKIGNTLTPVGLNTEVNYDALLKNLPLNAEKIKISNDSLESALFQLGKVYQENIEDYPLAVETYEKLLSRNANPPKKDQLLFNLYYSYRKLKDDAKANYYKQLLQQQFPGGKYANLTDPGMIKISADSILKREATKTYDTIYVHFIEGDFEKAVTEKRAADSMYGKKFWTPQLTYIEAVYHIRQRNDSMAKILLSDIVTRFSHSPLRARAENLLNVLNRRNEIETYLTNLKVERATDDTTKKENKPTQIIPPVVSDQKVNVKQQQDVVHKNIRTDTGQKKIPAPAKKTNYTFHPDQPQMVMIILDKVDPVYVTETKNAFNRYNKEKYYNKVIEINNVPLDNDVKMVILKNFATANEALDYIDKAKKVAGGEIVPWLPKDKYSFYLISADNLEILQSSKDLATYKEELSIAYPGKF